MTVPSPSSLPSAEAYELYQSPALFGPFAIELVTCAAPQLSEHVLDLNHGMFAVAHDVARETSTPITFHHGDMQALPFADRSYIW